VEDVVGSMWLGNPTTSKIKYDAIKEVLLAEEYNSFQLSGKKQDCLHFRDFLKYKCEMYLKQTIYATTT
jgi:hypothetical protein